jgi:predicted Rossmann fold nucleotide-binding protein DprA/Smf involved in DNA uptake
VKGRNVQTEEILNHIGRLKKDLRKDAAPADISAACAGLSIYLMELNDSIYDLEQSYKVEAADIYVGLIKEGKSATASENEVNRNLGIISQKIQVDRLKALTKRVDMMISAHQSYLKMLDSSSKGNL